MDHDPVASIQTLPAIALRGLTVFPNVLIHFDVGRAASIKAMEAAMAAGEPVFLVGQKDMTVERPERDDLYTVGTLSNVRQILRMPGDNVRVMVEGISRGPPEGRDPEGALFDGGDRSHPRGEGGQGLGQDRGPDAQHL